MLALRWRTEPITALDIGLKSSAVGSLEREVSRTSVSSEESHQSAKGVKQIAMDMNAAYDDSMIDWGSGKNGSRVNTVIF